MKQLVFKPMQIFAMATLVLVIGNSCKKQPLTPADVAINEANSTASEKSVTDLTATANPFNVRVGAPVDGRTGTRWIKNLKRHMVITKLIRLVISGCRLLLTNPIV